MLHGLFCTAANGVAGATRIGAVIRRAAAVVDFERCAALQNGGSSELISVEEA